MSLAVWLADGLPVGFQIMAPAFADDRMYRVAGALEAELDARRGHPPARRGASPVTVPLSKRSDAQLLAIVWVLTLAVLEIGIAAGAVVLLVWGGIGLLGVGAGRAWCSPSAPAPVSQRGAARRGRRDAAGRLHRRRRALRGGHRP